MPSRAASLAAAVAFLAWPARAVAQGMVDPRTGFPLGPSWDDPPPRSNPPEPPPPPPAPRAPDPPAAPFGSPGEWVITGASSLGLSATTYEASDARSFSLSVSPGVDWFFSRNVSVGLDLEGAYSSNQGYGADSSLVATKATTLSAGGRLGVNLSLGKGYSIYPRMTVGLESVTQDEKLVAGSSLSIAGAPLGYPTTSRFGPWLNLYVPVLGHLTSHAFLGFGPTLFLEFGAWQGAPNTGGERTAVGASFVVGGWGGGPKPTAGEGFATEPDVGEDSTPPRRFGEAREIVVSSDISAGINYLGYAGSGSSSLVGTFAPGIDYFVTDHVALGVGAGVSYSSVTGINPTTSATVTVTSTALALAPRMAFEIPVGAPFSVYIRAALGFGAGWLDERSVAADNPATTRSITVSLYAPFVVHCAQHFFTGLGPLVDYDASRIVTEYGTSNRRTTFGVALLVGAWL